MVARILKASIQAYFGIFFLPLTLHSHSAPIKVLLDRGPVSLNPRQTIDASGQRLSSLLFASLTKVNSKLIASPDLATHWENRPTKTGSEWIFWLNSAPRLDHEKQISPALFLECLENYRNGKPKSLTASGMSEWIGTELVSHSNGTKGIKLILNRNSPYFAKDVSLLRYFRIKGENGPCKEPSPDQEIIGSGPYQISSDISFNPKTKASETLTLYQNRIPVLELHFVTDDTTGYMMLIRGDVDVAFNYGTFSKENWLKSKSHLFNLTTTSGINTQYMAFNLKDPILKNVNVRRAISLAIDRASIIQNKHFQLSEIAGSTLSHHTEDGLFVPYVYDPIEAKRLLDLAGYPMTKNGFRFTLKYKTTSTAFGVENALMFQDMLKKVGINLSLDTVESAVFLNGIQKGKFQVYSSRWAGASDGSILYSTLHSNEPKNRVYYSNEKVDAILQQAMKESNPSKRATFFKTAQAESASDLPYFPLWIWKNVLISKKDIEIPPLDEISLSGAWDFLPKLRRVKNE
jgi:peptide/nickel transport system substrate-binding protein